MMEEASKLQESETDHIEMEFYREIAEETLVAAYFDRKSLNTRQFLDKIQEVYTLAQLKEADAALAIAVLISTRARVRREIRSDTMSAVAEKVATLLTKSRIPRTIECDAASNFLHKSTWLENAKLKKLVKKWQKLFLILIIFKVQIDLELYFLVYFLKMNCLEL